MNAGEDWGPGSAHDRRLARLGRLIGWVTVALLLALSAVCVVMIWRLLQPQEVHVCRPVPVVSVPPPVPVGAPGRRA